MPTPAELRRAALDHIDSVLEQAAALRRQAKHDDFSGGNISEGDFTAFATRARVAIKRVAGAGTVYYEDSQRFVDLYLNSARLLAQRLLGVLHALRTDVDTGLTGTFRELIHGELFSDYIEMASHLLSEGFKDAASVIAGSTLEAHLRQLCTRIDISTTRPTATGAEPKKAEALNQDLRSAGAYSVLDQKNVTAWLDLRNKAAHGRYTEYTKEQVGNMLSGVREFLTRLPA